MRVRFGLAIILLMVTVASAARAHHPGADLDAVMGDKERFFQAIDAPAPPFLLADAQGQPVRLSDFADKIVVLNFIFAGCTDVCPLHTALIADVQSKVNRTAMRDLVQFVSVTTDPATDTADVLQAYAATHGLDTDNWMFLTKQATDPEAATRQLAATYDVRFEPLGDGQQMHAAVTHVIDRGGRFAAKFHGLRFDPLNLLLYLNGLANAPSERLSAVQDGWWSRFKGLLP